MQSRKQSVISVCVDKWLADEGQNRSEGISVVNIEEVTKDAECLVRSGDYDFFV